MQAKNNNYLYIVSTPIGNLKDITLRALECLKYVDIIACEDTRVSQKLLQHYGILNKRLLSYGNHNLKSATQSILQELKKGHNVALISDAGTPIISDPGTNLVEECYKEGLRVTTLPGPCALISALTLAGIQENTFYFGGFFANKAGDLVKQFTQLQNLKSNLVFYCAANKFKNSLLALTRIFPSTTKIAVARELTKIFEEFQIHTIEEWLLRLNKPLKGELVVIIPPREQFLNIDITEQIELMKALLLYLPAKSALAVVKQYFATKGIKVNTKELYNVSIEHHKTTTN